MSARPSLPARRFRRSAILTVLLAVPALLVSACAGSGSAASTTGGSATLKWATSYFPTHWDPVVSGSGAQFRELALVYSALTRTDSKGNAVPDLAASWKYNSTGNEITFHLRPNL
ncbi:MAG: peptide/nickel transport system substrate-binding protein, partial [Pseudonocardiales bacterium]|nr:peptide/nickel transport system substrate-binding protein [Pseudonocardiales bacterium]